MMTYRGSAVSEVGEHAITASEQMVLYICRSA